jgi:hypothetical protein
MMILVGVYQSRNSREESRYHLTRDKRSKFHSFTS